jgi:hypothetical protein
MNKQLKLDIEILYRIQCTNKKISEFIYACLE